jgi:hypothetical protein
VHGATELYSGRLAGTAFLFIGIAAIGSGLALVLVAAAPLLALALVGLPACAMGSIAVLSGAASFSTRIEIARDALVLEVPQWRGCPLPPVAHRRIRWNEITALRHRMEIYCLLPGGGLPMPVDCYAIETMNERLVLAGKSVPHLATAMRAISAKSGQPLRENPPAPTGIFASLMKGPPAWDNRSFTPQL